MSSAVLLLVFWVFSAAAQTVRLQVEQDGVHQVTYHDLIQAGLPSGSVWLSAHLSLSSGGEAVAMRVDDGEDGRFGPGDKIEFVGRSPRGRLSRLDPYTRFNPYLLHFGSQPGLRMQPLPVAEGSGNVSHLNRRLHFEEDHLRPRFAHLPGRRQDAWLWARLNHIDSEPFRFEIELAGLDPDGSAPVTLRFCFRGWSRQSELGGLKEHRVEAFWNGSPAGWKEWDGDEEVAFEVSLPPGSARESRNLLVLKVPARWSPGAVSPLIDVVLLNWVAVEYPVRSPLDRQAELWASDAQQVGEVELEFDRPETAVYTLNGFASPARLGRGARGGRFAVGIPASEPSFFVVPPGSYLSPARIEIDRSSDLHSVDKQSDYLIISHPDLIDAVRPLADFHRRRGLSVKVASIQDVYDEFSHSRIDPEAMRRFVDYAYHRWRPPAPRFVLLVGDASWDPNNPRPDAANYADWTFRPKDVESFASIPATSYASAAGRGLIPTGSFDTAQDHSASDNYFVSVEGGDALPDLAIGRFPVVAPQEVSAIVEKTLAYMRDTEPAAWKQRTLMITNELAWFQRRSDRLAAFLEQRGLSAAKIYPQPAERDNAIHQRRIVEALNLGQFLVHFDGHGGRFIWRTGPPDIRKNHDLFTLDHVDLLENGARLPIVLSMTCYSAPFDHPTADSIGEKFLRAPGRGAVAVLAASWRVNPSEIFSRLLLDQLTRPGTIGEAVMRAKRSSSNRAVVEGYNLLGDPAIPIHFVTAEDPLPSDGPDGDRARQPMPFRTPSAPSVPEPENSATEGEMHNTLEWVTASEEDNFGFDIYRSLRPQGPFERITATPIQGAGSSDTERHYVYRDREADPERDHYYYIESIALDGRRERFSPVVKAPAKRPGIARQQ